MPIGRVGDEFPASVQPGQGFARAAYWPSSPPNGWTARPRCAHGWRPPGLNPEHTILIHARTWLPLGLTAVVILFINISVLFAATLPLSEAESAPASTEAVRAVAPAEVVPAPEAPLTDRTHRSVGSFPAEALAEQAVIEAAILTGRERLDAASESADRAQARRADAEAAAERAAAEQHAAAHAAAELRTASHTTESASAPEPAPADDHHARAERAADAMPFDWRAHGITFKVGCHPDQDRCSWGTFDHRVDEVWLSSAAFTSDARLRYVVAHELAHAWQWSTDLDDREADLTDFGVSTSDGIEYGADCIAKAWGYPVAAYWDCPSDAVAHMRSVFAATT